MDAAAALSVFAQLAVALTGFSGLLTGFRGGARWTPVELESLRILLVTSVGAMAFSIAPAPFLVAGADSVLVWTWGALALGAFLGFLFAGIMIIVFGRRLKARRPALMWTLTAGQFLIAALLLASAFDLFSLRGPGVYCAGIVWLLLIATLQFLSQIFSMLRGGEDPAPPAA